MAPKWEYWTGILYANIDIEGVRDFLKKKWPNWNPQEFGTTCLIPQLNNFGEEGWELIHMEPVAGVDKNGNLYFHTNIGAHSHAYFCVMKRIKD